jgi:SpoVK/Ycf46/Vps4 family AAA+-type ATPase
MAKFPPWALKLAEMYRGGTIIEFILHGNVNDLVPGETSNGTSFMSLRDFLARQLFPRRDAVIYYDPSRGISFRDDDTFGDFHRVAKAVDAASGTKFASQGLPRDARRALYLIERYMRAKVDPRGGGDPKSVALVIEFSQLVMPAGELSHLSSEEQATLVTLLRWANDPVFLRSDLTVVMIVENLSELNQVLVKSPYIGRIEIKHPDAEERLDYLKYRFEQTPELIQRSEVDVKQFAKLTAGLSRVNLNHLTSQAVANDHQITSDYVAGQKKALIEKECYGLLEFLEAKHGLDVVCGHHEQKQWLRHDAGLIRDGKVDALPMGYLICGPVGTGKTFLSMCYTADIGIPCVKLLNFRSQWQGVTEGNWEKILNVLKATGPVGVIIDEADAAVGTRDAHDSGTSKRVFSMLAAQMGDTRYRGHILWFLLTSRPDLLPVDLKRQGRAEIHIPLFYPETAEERREMLAILSRKCKVDLAEEALEIDLKAKLIGHVDEYEDEDEDEEEGEDEGHEHGPDCDHDHEAEEEDWEEEDAVRTVDEIIQDHLANCGMSGAEVESILIRSKRRAYIESRTQVTKDDLLLESGSYIPNLSPQQLELQMLAAILECSDRRFLPKRLAALDRDAVQSRYQELKARERT